MTTTTLSKERLFTFLLADDFQVKKKLVNRAKDNDPGSLSKIADIYYKKKDYAKAIGWYHLAANKNSAHSQNRIGWMYQHGESVSMDYKLAMKWYLEAHGNGNIAATNNIGVLYSTGQGVNQDHKTALKWFLEAANKGNEIAQNNVGICYEKGYGVKIDMQYALEWYEKSAENGYEGAKSNVERLNKKGFCLENDQKRYLQMEKEINRQKEKITELENRLKSSEQENDNKMGLLQQELKLLKLKINNSKKVKTETSVDKENILQFIRELSDGLKSKTDYCGDNQNNSTHDIYY